MTGWAWRVSHHDRAAGEVWGHPGGILCHRGHDPAAIAVLLVSHRGHGPVAIAYGWDRSRQRPRGGRKVRAGELRAPRRGSEPQRSRSPGTAPQRPRGRGHPAGHWGEQGSGAARGYPGQPVALLEKGVGGAEKCRDLCGNRERGAAGRDMGSNAPSSAGSRSELSPPDG